MLTAFSTALSALSANSTAVDIVGNNLANLNTTGFKADSVDFQDLMSQAIGVGSGATAVGLGVSGAQAVKQFAQGAIQQTSGAFDAAIQGNGFFVVRDQNNQQLFTRAGNFKLDATGHMQTATGEYVQGWNAQAGVLNPNSAVGDIVIPVNGVSPATATTSMSLTVNLDAAATVGASTGTYSAPVQVVDAQGGIHTLTVTFTKTDVNSWDYAVNIPDADLTTPGTTPLASGSLTFDGTGQLASPTATDPPIEVTIAGLADGADDLTVNWSLFNGTTGLLTQFAQASGVSAAAQDGIPAGQIVKVGIRDGGLIVAQYSSGLQATVGQVALASIQNPDSLVAVGNNNLQASPATSAPAIGAADSGGRGKISGGSLESSTVDIAREFTNLITLQRSYQANSRVVTTTDAMLQDLINLIR